MGENSARVIAIIPARGGSKRIPGKNLLPLAGEPLVVHTIRHALMSSLVDDVYVSTDDPGIAREARSAGAKIVDRFGELASDTATTESALLHCLDIRRELGLKDPEIVVLLQCTSPIRRPDDIDNAIQLFWTTDSDSLLSVCETKRYVWSRAGESAKSLNYDFRHRKREQDFDAQYQENGSIYVCKTSVLRDENNRLGGKIALYEMDYWASFQIDTPEDVDLCEWIARRPEYRDSLRLPEILSLIVFDFDGVMTDNMVQIDSGGNEMVVCNRGDGLGISMLKKAGVPMMVLSTEINSVVEARSGKLGLPCYQGIPNKGEFLKAYLADHSISPGNTLYLGNDVNDLDCLKLVGCPVAVADAHKEVLPYAKMILRAPGGRGAVRELADLVLSGLKKGRVALHA